MASKYLQKYQVPEGFYDILHEFTREVLRAQPEDIIEYAANYFEHKAQGKEYYFESKYNIQKPNDKYDLDNQKKYNPTPHQDYTEQAKRVVQASNQRVDAQGSQTDHKSPHHQKQQSGTSQKSQQQQVAPSNQPQRLPSGNSGRPQTQNSVSSDKPNDTSKVSYKSKKSDISHPEEKKISKEFVGDLYNSALHKALHPQDKEQAYDQEGEEIEGQEDNQQNFGYEEGEGQEEGQFEQQQQYYEGGEEGEAEYGQEEGGEYFEGQEGQDGQQEGQEYQEGQQYEGQEEQAYEEEQQQQQQQEEVVLEGPVEEYQNVALKIQSVFRGNKVRKDMKNP